LHYISTVKRRNQVANMSLGALLKKQLTPSKLVFHVLFWTFHWGIFAYGWYVPGYTNIMTISMADMRIIGGSKRPMPV